MNFMTIVKISADTNASGSMSESTDVESNLYFLVLRKRAGESYGLNIAYNDQDKFHFIEDVFPGTVARRCEEIFPNDRIIEINQCNVVRLDHEAVISMIRASVNSITLLLGRPSHLNSRKQRK